MSILGWGTLLLLTVAFFKYCFLPVLEAILRIVDPDEGAGVRADLAEIARVLERSDRTLAEATNRVRDRLGLRRL
jgi:hypothetical protein